ncbi:MAG: hypothetical protein ACRD4C_03545 [Candidatus Acidiferrales bacterium]
MAKRNQFFWQLLYPETVNFKCPFCNFDIPYLSVKIWFRAGWVQEYFQCPGCKTLLCVSAAYVWLVMIGTLLASIIITLALKLSWFLFVPAVILTWIFVVMIVGGYIKILIPPKIRQYYPPDLSLIRRNSRIKANKISMGCCGRSPRGRRSGNNNG